MRRHLFWTTLTAALAAGIVFVGSATAAPATSSTVHFNSLVGQLGAPTGPTTNISDCPAPVINDFTSIDATGNGISHQTTNGAGDFWSTSTFTGTATVTFYPNGTFDSMGNVIGVSGTPDMQVTGHLTEWFGTSANNQNAVFHGTVNFNGVTVFPNPGTPIRFHNVVHGAYLPGADQNGPPSFFFNVASC
jgi:hypothetical protein